MGSVLMVWNPSIKETTDEVHREFLRAAYDAAAKNSDDPKTKTGAIIVSSLNRYFRAVGWNHLPKGLESTPELLNNSEWKYKHIIHAEPASVNNAARYGIRTEGTTMYMPWVPCTDCAITIIDAGIETLIGHKEMIMKTPERWQESTDYALDLLEKAGVKKLMYVGKIGGVENLFDGKIWMP